MKNIMKNLFFGIVLIGFHVTIYPMKSDVLSKKSHGIIKKDIIKHFNKVPDAKNKIFELSGLSDIRNRLILQDKVKKFNLRIDKNFKIPKQEFYYEDAQASGNLFNSYLALKKACDFEKCPEEICKKLLTTIKNDLDLTRQDTAANKAKQFARLYIYTKVSTTALKLLLNCALGNSHNNIAEELCNEVISDCKNIAFFLPRYFLHRDLITTLSLLYNNPHNVSFSEKLLHDIQSDIGLHSSCNQNSYISNLEAGARLNIMNNIILILSSSLQKPFLQYINLNFPQLPSELGPQFQEDPSMLLGVFFGPIIEESIFTYFGNSIVTDLAGKAASQIIIPFLFGLSHNDSQTDPRTNIQVLMSTTQKNILRTYYFQKYDNLVPCIVDHMLNNFWGLITLKKNRK